MRSSAAEDGQGGQTGLLFAHVDAEEMPELMHDVDVPLLL
jgi:hypothetical protein